MMKIRKRISAVTLAAAMLLTMPGTASYAKQAAGDAEIPKMKTSAAMEPEEGSSDENIPETVADDGKEPETGAEGAGEGSPCAYGCRICLIEDLIAALPDKVTEDNADVVRAQMDEILALYANLTEEEQEQADISLCLELQGELDAASEPVPVWGWSGDFGDNNALHWEMDGTTLTISGEGAMPDFSGGSTPWQSKENVVSSIKIENGVTSIGSGAFKDFATLGTVSIPESVKTIGASAFEGCYSSLLDITIPKSVESIGDRAFYGCKKLATATFEGETTPTLDGSGVFTGTSDSLKIFVPEGASGYDGENWPAGKVVGEQPGVPVAKVGKDGEITEATSLAEAFAYANSGATVTLIADVAEQVEIPQNTDFTLDLNGHSITHTKTCTTVMGGSNLTIEDSKGTGTITSNSIAVYVLGSLTLEGGKFLTDSPDSVGVKVDMGSLSVTGEGVYINALSIKDSSKDGKSSLSLSAGTYGKIVIYGSQQTFEDFLIPNYAYYKDGKPLALDGLGEAGDGGGLTMAGPVTVKACGHDSEHLSYTHTTGVTAHKKKCLACGSIWAAEDCQFIFTGNVGTCQGCQSELTVALIGADGLAYAGKEHKPDVTVTIGGETLDAGNYTVSYKNNINATNTERASVTVSGTGWGCTQQFSIEKAALAIKADDQTIIYGGSIAKDAAQVAGGTLYGGAVLQSVVLTASNVNVPGGDIIPSKAVITKAGEDVTGNYAVTYLPGRLAINKAQGTLAVPGTSISKKFGDGEFSLNCSTNGDGKISYTSSNEHAASVSENGTVQIKGVGTTEITAALGEGTNHTGGAEQKITLTVEKADAPDIKDETKYYNYLKGSGGAAIIDVAGKLPEGRGETKYACAFIDTEGILSDISVDSNGNLSYTVQGNRQIGDTASIMVTAEMANYNTATYTLKIEIVEKIPVKITAEPENSVYDGSPKAGFAGLAADGGYTGGYVYEYTGTGETVYSGSEPPVHAGSYTVAIRVSDGEYTGSSDKIPFTIEKASVTVRADDKNAETGSPLPELTYTASGLAGADRLAVQPQLSCSADMRRAGVYPITVGSAKVPDTGNYKEEIAYVDGKLTVAAAGSTGGSGNSGGSGSGTGGSGSYGGSTGSTGGSGSYGGNTGSSRPAQPFLKDSSGREGWDVIRAEAEKAAAAPEGGTVDVDMNGASAVPGSVFAKIKGRDVTMLFHMGGGIVWSVSGKDITADTVDDTDFSVKAGTGFIPQEAVGDVPGGLAHLELRLAHDGAFGFAAVLSIRIIKKGEGIAVSGSGGTAAGYTGMYANLFYYNPASRSLEFVSAGQIAGDGTVRLPFAHASDYAVVISAEPVGAAGDAQEPAKPAGPEDPANPAGQAKQPKVKSVKLSKTVYTYSGKAKKPSVTAVDTDGEEIPKKYYTVSYKNNKNAGTAQAVIKFKGAYSGTVKKAFTIRPLGTAILKLVPASGGFTAKWKKKAAQTDGYQVQYSTGSRFQGGSTHSVFIKKSAVKNAPAGTCTVKKLKASKKYYVRIRTYKNVKEGGKSTRVYSAWSSVVRVKTLPAAPAGRTASFRAGTASLMEEKKDGRKKPA